MTEDISDSQVAQHSDNDALLDAFLTDITSIRTNFIAGNVDVAATRAEVVKLVTDYAAGLAETIKLVTDLAVVHAVLDGIVSGSGTWDPGSLADGVGETSASITATGALLGDFVLVSAPYDLQGITCSAYVDANDSVKIRLQNETTGTLDLASGTWKVRVLPAASFVDPAALTAVNPAAATAVAPAAVTAATPSAISVTE